MYAKERQRSRKGERERKNIYLCANVTCRPKTDSSLSNNNWHQIISTKQHEIILRSLIPTVRADFNGLFFFIAEYRTQSVLRISVRIYAIYVDSFDGRRAHVTCHRNFYGSISDIISWSYGNASHIRTWYAFRARNILDCILDGILRIVHIRLNTIKAEDWWIHKRLIREITNFP